MQTYNDNAKYDRYISLFKKFGDNNYCFDKRVKFDCKQQVTFISNFHSTMNFVGKQNNC